MALLGALVIAAAMSGPQPFFMFTTSKFGRSEGAAIRSALDKYITRGDYLGLRLGQEFPEIGRRVGRSHLYVLPPSLRAVARHSEQCGDGTAGLIVYDGENWPATPPDEQADIPAAISRGRMLVASRGCHAFGVAPGGEIVGIVPEWCSYDLGRAIHHRIALDGVTLFNIQAQRLLSDDCNKRAGVNAYVRFVSAVARDVHAKTPQTKVSAQLSFRYTPPSRMIEAIGRLRGIVDGFYLAYPSNVGPRCAYCTPQNLEEVLAAIRGHRMATVAASLHGRVRVWWPARSSKPLRPPNSGW